MSKNYENLKVLCPRVVEVFKSRNRVDFGLWVRKELKPLDTAAVLHDAMSALVQNSSTPVAVPDKKEQPEVVTPEPVNVVEEIDKPASKSKSSKKSKK